MNSFVSKRNIIFRDYDVETKLVRVFGLDEYDKNEHDSYGNITQYTEKNDSHGSKIFEGDYVLVKIPNSPFAKGKVALVVFSENHSAFVYFCPSLKIVWVGNAGLYKISSKSPGAYYEVVGNVYQNDYEDLKKLDGTLQNKKI